MKSLYRSKSTLLILWLVCGAAICSAQPQRSNSAGSREENVDTNEPLVQELFVSELTRTQDRRELQVTLGSYLASERGEFLAQSLLKSEYGLSDRVQIESEFSYVAGQNEDGGLEELSFGARYAFVPRSHRLSLTGGLNLTTMNPESAELQLEPNVAAGFQIGKADVHIGAAASLTGTHEYESTFSVIYPIGRWRSTFEWKAVRADVDNATLIAPGLIRNFHGFEVGIGAPLQLSGSGPRFAAMFLVTHEFRRD